MRRPVATHRTWITALVATAMLSACSSGTSVGGDDLTRGLGDAVDLERLGGPTDQPDMVPSQTEPGSVVTPTDTPAATTSPPGSGPATPDPTPTPTVAAITISINPDGAEEPQFAPRVATIRPGSTVLWVNQDSVERSVVAQDQSFVSPPIPPGGSWSYPFEQVGRFDYHDGTRVYVLGTVEVVP